MASTSQAPLVKADWKRLQSLSKQWIKNNPTCQIKELSRARRIWDEGARASFSVAMCAHEPSGSLSHPCQSCGLWTHSYCECCSPANTPYPICSSCDEEKISCRRCLQAGKSWEVAHEAHSTVDNQNVIQVSGYMENDTFVRLNPPLSIPLTRVQRHDTEDVDESLLLEEIRKLTQND